MLGILCRPCHHFHSSVSMFPIHECIIRSSVSLVALCINGTSGTMRLFPIYRNTAPMPPYTAAPHYCPIYLHIWMCLTEWSYFPIYKQTYLNFWINLLQILPTHIYKEMGISSHSPPILYGLPNIILSIIPTMHCTEGANTNIHLWPVHTTPPLLRGIWYTHNLFASLSQFCTFWTHTHSTHPLLRGIWYTPGSCVH